MMIPASIVTHINLRSGVGVPMAMRMPNWTIVIMDVLMDRATVCVTERSTIVSRFSLPQQSSP